MFYRRISWTEAAKLWQSSTPIYLVNELFRYGRNLFAEL